MKEDTMRIGLFSDTYLPDINGVVSSTHTLKKALEKLGHTVYVITNHKGVTITQEGNVLRLPGVELKGLYGYKMSSPVNANATDRIRQMNLDVIHLQTNFGVGLYGQMLARNLNIPVVDTYHTMYEDYTHYINPMGLSGFERVSKDAIRKASRAVCNRVEAVIAPSEKTLETLRDYGVQAPIFVVPTGIDLEAFEVNGTETERLEKIRASVSTDPEARILLYLGRLAKEKDLEMPIEAIASSPDTRLHLAIVGSGPDEDYYKNYAKQFPGSDRIHFLGVADPNDVPDFYKAFDAYVSASLSETQGMTYLESMATGTMVFGRRDEVLENLLVEGKTGYYFDNKEELLEKIEQFYALDETAKEENAKLCRQKIEPYTTQSFADKVLQVYEKAIEDYSNTYEIDQIKVNSDFVAMTLHQETAREESVEILMPMEDYFELQPSLHSRLDSYMVENYLQDLPFYQAWRKAKKRALSRDMTEYQMQTWLMRSQKLDEIMARVMTNELVMRALISDERYAFDKADYWQSLGVSVNEIRRKLQKAGISSTLINEAIARLKPELERENAITLAKSLAKKMNLQSGRRKRQNVMHKLISKGFKAEEARWAIDSLDVDEQEDKEALQACFAKAKRLYAGREGWDYRQHVINYCLRQGFSRSTINEMLEQEESVQHD